MEATLNCGVPGAVETHRLAQAVFDVAADPNHTHYDILASVAWAAQEDIVATNAALTAHFTTALDSSGNGTGLVENTEGCTCVADLAAALAHVTAAWAAIGAPAARALYDASALPGGMLAPPPVVIVPNALTPPPQAQITKTRVDCRRIDSNDGNRQLFGPTIGRGGLEGTPEAFVEITSTPYTVVCRKIENSFWFSLAMCLARDPSLGPWVKAQTRAYWDSVNSANWIDAAGVNFHPRGTLYAELDAACNARLAANFSEQLEPDNPGAVPPTFATAPLPELWQLVADTFQVELIVFSPPRGRSRKWKAHIRGDHAHRQVFMAWEPSFGSCTPLEPLVPSPHRWRYTKHMSKITLASRPCSAAEWARYARKVTPVIRMSIATGLPERSPSGIVDSLAPMVGTRYTAPWLVPRAYDEGVERTCATPALIASYYNTGEWF